MEMNSRSDWADFPPEVLRLVARELADIQDYIRFRAVCVSWRLAAGPTDLGPQLPWLVAPTLKEGCNFNQDGITTVSFFNLPGCRRCFYPLDIPETQGKWIYASAHGWLLMIGSCSPQSTSSVSLLNPITRAIIQLPLLPVSRQKGSNIQKALLCTHPASSPPGRLLAAVWINDNTVTFFRQGDTDWTIIKSASDIVYLDIVYFKDEIYFVDRHGILSLLQLESSTIIPLIHPRQLEVKPFRSLYLVEAAGDLLLIARYVLVFKLAVFKLHMDADGELNWVSIGDMTPDPAGIDGYCRGKTDLAFFTSWSGSLCARTLPHEKGYQIYSAEAREINSQMIITIREINAINGVGINMIEQSYCQARERVGRQRQFLSIGVTWMLPNLH